MSIQIRNANKELVFFAVAKTSRGFNARQRKQIAAVRALMATGIKDRASIRVAVNAL